MGLSCADGGLETQAEANWLPPPRTTSPAMAGRATLIEGAFGSTDHHLSRYEFLSLGQAA